MKNKLFLTKLIEKAIKNGWKSKGIWFRTDNGEPIIFSKDDLSAIIFNQSFCKAIWPVNTEYHIMHLALSEDRIKYLKENVKL